MPKPILAVATVIFFAFLIHGSPAEEVPLDKSFLGSPAVDLDGLPINMDVDQSKIGETICKKGWTATVRPPEAFTQEIKRQLLTAAGQPVSDAREYELDHVIPLELGGAPSDKRNLQMQLWPEAHQKDEVENCLRATVCAGKLGLNEARFMIWHDWRKAKDHCK